ncbi:MAG TPA: 3-deoxy-manno-octulosonate cytidylyltransferase [Pseudobdellovibrionaceae bacterium]|jgi:3-deoxy-manno-octulosonate cytidylyltransferase (CMP-KDO synthetase)
MKFIGVIPARYASTRFPAKPLALLQGKPMIQWVVEGARKSQLLSEVIVATDHEEIRKAVEAIGGKVVMTDSNLPSGTDRIQAAVRDLDFDVVINIQGDEPLVNGELIDSLAGLFRKGSGIDMATLAHPISAEELESVNAVKVVLNRQDEALYFSRYAIPYSRVSGRQALSLNGSLNGCLKHIGMYAYTKKFLKTFCEAAPAAIEVAESLEQLRALYLGAKIKVLRVKEASLGVDTPEDLVKLEKLLGGN